ncbi:MAG: hypothetical protein EP322_00095 [Bacteroidetes bacterium]|nr:MAG: hypothetical protein EP322_00095 [Bacteroidota bacterium]
MLKYKEYTVVSFVVMYCVLDMLVKGGRGGVYSIVLCSVYAACVLVIWKEIVLSRKLLIAVSSLVGISSILLAFIGLARDGGAVGSGLTYHVVGFSLLSDLLENGTYYLSHDLTLGRLTFGGIDYFITALIRFIFDESYNTPVYLNVSIQNLPVLTMDSLSIIAREVNPEYYTYNTHNAFYTVLSTVYLDFGFMGAPLLGLITGVGLVRCEWLFRKESSYISVVFMIFIFYNSVTGIFASPLETPGFWGAALIIWFVSVVSSGNFLEKVRR